MQQKVHISTIIYSFLSFSFTFESLHVFSTNITKIYFFASRLEHGCLRTTAYLAQIVRAWYSQYTR